MTEQGGEQDWHPKREKTSPSAALLPVRTLAQIGRVTNSALSRRLLTVKPTSSRRKTGSSYGEVSWPRSRTSSGSSAIVAPAGVMVLPHAGSGSGPRRLASLNRSNSQFSIISSRLRASLTASASSGLTSMIWDAGQPPRTLPPVARSMKPCLARVRRWKEQFHLVSPPPCTDTYGEAWPQTPPGAVTTSSIRCTR